MPRLKMILNPAADHGHARALRPDLQTQAEEQARLRKQNGPDYELDWVETSAPGHAIELARRAAEEGFEIVVAAGGDGTVHEVVNGLMQVDTARRPLLGVIPIGSGNDFAYNLGIPHNPIKALGRLFDPRSRSVDAGFIKSDTGREAYWDNTVGIGFSGAVNIATRRLERWRGFTMYLIAVLQTILFRPPHLRARLEIDGDPPFEEAISMLSLCNGPREGGGFAVAPEARMDDGLLTYTIMRKMGRLNMLRFLPIVMNGKHLRFTRFFKSGTARRIHVKTDETMAIHTDGEVFGPWEAGIREVEVSIIPAALRVLCGGQGD